MTADEARQLLDYDPDTGIFRWKVNTRQVNIGQIAGCVKKNKRQSYIVIRVNKRGYYAHRLAWFFMTGVWPVEVDHKDRNGLNNCWLNLREVTRPQNLMNTNGYGQSGVKNVSPHKASGGWQVQLVRKGEPKIHETFLDFEAAVAFAETLPNRAWMRG